MVCSLRNIQTELPYHQVCRSDNRTFRFNQRRITRIFIRAIKEIYEKYSLVIRHMVLKSSHYHIFATATKENLHKAMSRGWLDTV